MSESRGAPSAPLPASGADPPYVPIRHTRWPTQRTPRWIFLAVGVLAVIGVLVSLSYRPSQSQRASDLRGFLADVTSDIESCAGGVSESLTALHGIDAGVSRGLSRAALRSETADTINIATAGAANCSLANNMQLDDLQQYQVTESLASFNLARVVNGLVTWASPDAQRVQNDVALVLLARGPHAKRTAMAELSLAVRKLDAQRAGVDKAVNSAIKALAAHAKPPNLPG